MTKPPALTLARVTLLQPHEHEGKPYAQGDEIAVNAADRAWLIEQQVIAALDRPGVPNKE